MKINWKKNFCGEKLGCGNFCKNLRGKNFWRTLCAMMIFVASPYLCANESSTYLAPNSTPRELQAISSGFGKTEYTPALPKAAPQLSPAQLSPTTPPVTTIPATIPAAQPLPVPPLIAPREQSGVVHAYTNNALREPNAIRVVSQDSSRAPEITPAFQSTSSTTHNNFATPFNAPAETAAELSPPPLLENTNFSSTAPVWSGAENSENKEIAASEKSAEKIVAADDILDLTFASGEENSSNTLRKGLISAGAPDVTRLVNVVGGLMLVVGCFLLFSMFLRKVSPQAARALPKEVFENLGRTALSPKIQLQLLRLGNRLVLISITADGTNTVTEITDPDEVMQMLGMCRRLDTTSSTNAFRNVLNGNAMNNNLAENSVRASSMPKQNTARGNESLATLLAAGLVKN